MSGPGIGHDDLRRLRESLCEALAAVGINFNPVRPLSDWHEEDGPVLWWKFPIEEQPYVGSPLFTTWPGYHTHWTEFQLPVHAVLEQDHAKTVSAGKKKKS